MSRWLIPAVCAVAIGAPCVFAGASSANGDYTYLHVDLGRPDCFKGTTSVGASKADWVQNGVREGICSGTFNGSQPSPPFGGPDHRDGWSTWQRFGGEVRITVINTGDEGIVCYVLHRASDRCYTGSAAEETAPPGHVGGPLLIKVNVNPLGSDDQILVRGYCRKGNTLCTPHTVKRFIH
jgi:hypothetical protein